MPLFVPQPRRLWASYELALFTKVACLWVNLTEKWVFTSMFQKVPITWMCDADGEQTLDPRKCVTFVAGTDTYGWGTFVLQKQPTLH